MIMTRVCLEVMQMKLIAIFSKRDYSVLAWDHVEAAEKAEKRAIEEGFSVVRVVSAYSN